MMSLILFETVCWSICLMSSVFLRQWERVPSYALALGLALIGAPIAAIAEERTDLLWRGGQS